MLAQFFIFILGLALGIALGWLWHASRRPEQPALAPADVERSLQPLNEAMGKLDEQLQNLRTDRSGAYSSLASQVQAMMRTSTRLSDRTDQLVTALRAPQVRGRWGEMQLERVVELGGMVRHCDFDTQVNARLGEKTVRPDLIVHLAGGRQIVVDSKVPLSAFLDALDTTDPEDKAGYLRRHAHLLRTHVTQLADKRYTEAFHPTPEFVVCFVPADPFLDAALAEDPHLLDFAFDRGVVIATPTSLFALLRTVALGWHNEDISARADEVMQLGRQLYRRLNTVAEHYNKIGKHLDRAVESYNATISSVDSRVMVTARRLAEMEVPINRDSQPVELDHIHTRPKDIPLSESGPE